MENINFKTDEKISINLIPSNFLSFFCLPAVIKPPSKTKPNYEKERLSYWNTCDIDLFEHFEFKNKVFTSLNPFLYLRFEILEHGGDPKLCLTNCPNSLNQTHLSTPIKYTYLVMDDAKIKIWKEWLSKEIN